MTARTASRGAARHPKSPGAKSKARNRDKKEAERTLSVAGRLGLAARTAFYLILVGLTIRIAVMGGSSGRQANAHGALALISGPLVGKIAIGAVALGFVLFGAGRLVGAAQDTSVSWTHRILTVLQGLFYVALAYVPASYLEGHRQSGSQQQQEQTTAKLLGLPGGRAAVIILGIIVLLVCAQQIRGALERDFEEGLDTRDAPPFLRRLAEIGGVVGIIARALVFAPVGVFLIVSAVEHNPSKSYGTDAELLHLSGHTWGLALLAVVATGLAVFVAYSAIETRYRRVISAR
jgi:hypothetical protein